MRTLHDLYEEEHGDEMTMGQLAVLAEARRLVANSLRHDPAAADMATMAIDRYASEIVDSFEDED